MEAIETTKVGTFTVATHYDDDPSEGPREWTNGTRMVLSHRRYNLPNEIDLDFDAFDSMNEVEAHIRETYDVVAMLPVQGYDHGSLHLACTDRGCFSDPWDSGMAGFIFMDRDGQTEVGTPDELLDDVLRGDVETYDQWANGDVYGYTVTDADGDVTDSCWGFIGDRDYAMSEGTSIATYREGERIATWCELPEWVRQTVIAHAIWEG